MVVQDGSLCSGTLRDALDITGTRGKLSSPFLHLCPSKLRLT